MRIKLFCVFFFIIPFCCVGQHTGVKIHLGSLALKNYNISLEQKVSSRASLVLNVGFVPKRELPSIVKDVLVDNEVSTDISFDGNSILGELRFYKRKNGSLKGFYFAPYASYRNYKGNYSDIIDDEAVEVEGKFTTIMGGIQLGTQWLIKNRVAIDWYFLGFSFGQVSTNLTYSSNDPATDYQDLQNDIDDELGDFDFLGVKITTESDNESVSAKVSALIPSIRSGISIGFVF